MSPSDRNPPFPPYPGARTPNSDRDRRAERPHDRVDASSSTIKSAAQLPSSSHIRAASRASIAPQGSTLDARSLIRVLCNAGSGALEYTHAFVTAYANDHFRGTIAQRLSVGAYELLSNALNYGSVSSSIVLELIESDTVVGVRVSNEAIQARISMLTDHLLKLRTNAEQTFLEELRRSVAGGIPRAMLGLARVAHEVALTLELQLQDRRISVTAQCRR